MIRNTYRWLLATLAFALSFTAVAAPASMAILGDSLSTGAATHPSLTYDTKQLWNVFTGRGDVAARRTDIPEVFRVAMPEILPAPQRPWPTQREFLNGPDWVFKNAMQILSRHYLDTEEYSWGYMLTAALSKPEVSPGLQQLMIAAEDGARTDQIARQTDRLLTATDGVLPASMFLLYTGNDLCGPNLDYVTTTAEYREALRSGLAYILRNGRTAAAGTDVYVLGFLSVLQLLHAEEIQNKPVQAFGTTMTCRELRQNGYRAKDPKYDPGLPPEDFYFPLMMPPNLTAICPTLFGEAAGVNQQTSSRQEAAISQLANLIRDYRVIQREVVEEFKRAQNNSQTDGSRLRFHFIEETTELVFGAEDIAQDCFHLSVQGQAKIAQAVLGHLQRLK